MERQQLSRLLIERSERSLFDTSIRIAPDVDPAPVLARLVHRLAVVAGMLDDRIVLYLEPNGDSCETGHFVDIEIQLGMVWADITAWPARYGGAVPTQIDTELELAGWLLIGPGADPDPYQHETGTPAELADLDPRADSPARRLVAVVGEDDLDEWAVLVAHGISRVIDPRARRWYLHAHCEVLDSGPFSDPPFGATAHVGDWSIDIGALLDDHEWERAIWPSDSEGGAMCCALGLHQFHEPPCRPHRLMLQSPNDD